MDLLSFNKLIGRNLDCEDVRQRHRLLYFDSASWYSSVVNHESEDVRLSINYVNSTLGDSDKRWDVLQVLSVIVQQGSCTVIIENYRGWIQHLRKFILHDVDLEVRLLAVKILGKIIYFCHSDPEHSRYLASNFVSTFIPQLLELDSTWLSVVVHGLYYILVYLTGSSRPFMTGIQKRLIGALNSNDSDVIELSALCISRIPFASAVAERGSSPSSVWLDLFQKLMKTVHSLLNSLYKDFEIEKPVHIDLSEQVPLPLTVEDSDASTSFIDCFYRFKSICICLEKMLKFGDLLLTVPVENVLQVVSRILKVNGKSLVDNDFSSQRDLLFTILPMAHSCALRILNALIISCRKHMLLHDRHILNLLLHSLSWPSAVWKTDQQKCALSKLRSFTYEVLINWLQVMGLSTDIAVLSESFLKRMILDAFHGQISAEDKIKNTSEIKQPVTKKRKNEQYLALSPVSYSKVTTDDKLCCAALKGLRVLLYNCGEDVKLSQLNELFSRISNTLLKLQRSSAELESDVQFSNYKCRKALYKVLLALITSKSLITHEVVTKSIKIFSAGCSDRNPEVAQLCFQAESQCHTFIEPARRCLPVRTSVIQNILQSQSTEENVFHKSSDNLLNTGFTITHNPARDAQVNANELAAKQIIVNEENCTPTNDTVKETPRVIVKENVLTHVSGNDKVTNRENEIDNDYLEYNLSDANNENDVMMSSVQNIVDLTSDNSDVEVIPVNGLNKNECKESETASGIDLSICKISSVPENTPHLKTNRHTEDDVTKCMLSSFVMAEPD